MWLATAEYEDGTYIEKMFPYTANGNSALEAEEQYRIEEWLINHIPGIVYYSVDYVED